MQVGPVYARPRVELSQARPQTHFTWCFVWLSEFYVSFHEPLSWVFVWRQKNRSADKYAQLAQRYSEEENNVHVLEDEVEEILSAESSSDLSIEVFETSTTTPPANMSE